MNGFFAPARGDRRAWPPPRLHIPYAAATRARLVLYAWAELTGQPPLLTHEVVGVFREHWAYTSAKARARPRLSHDAAARGPAADPGLAALGPGGLSRVALTSRRAQAEAGPHRRGRVRAAPALSHLAGGGGSWPLAAFLFNWQVLPRLGGRAPVARERARRAATRSASSLYPAQRARPRARLPRRSSGWWRRSGALLAVGDGMASHRGPGRRRARACPGIRARAGPGFVAFVVFGAVAAALLSVWTLRLPLGAAASPWILDRRGAASTLAVRARGVGADHARRQPDRAPRRRHRHRARSRAPTSRSSSAIPASRGAPLSAWPSTWASPPSPTSRARSTCAGALSAVVIGTVDHGRPRPARPRGDDRVLRGGDRGHEARLSREGARGHRAGEGRRARLAQRLGERRRARGPGPARRLRRSRRRDVSSRSPTPPRSPPRPRTPARRRWARPTGAARS